MIRGVRELRFDCIRNVIALTDNSQNNFFSILVIIITLLHVQMNSDMQ